MTVYVGTYTDGTSKGIYRSALDLATGKASAPVLAGEAKNPSFLALHPSGRFLYAVSEVDDFGGAKTGARAGVRGRHEDRRPHAPQPAAVEGAAPCHLVVDKSGKNVLVANYSGGNVAAASGSPRTAGSSRPPRARARGQRARTPRARTSRTRTASTSTPPSASRFAPDLGADRVFVYRFDARRARSSRTAGRPRSAGIGAAPPRVPPLGPLRLRDQRAHLDVTALRLRRREGPAHAAPDRLGAARGLPGHELHGRDRGLARRPLPLRLEPRPRQPGRSSAIDPASGRLTLAGHVPVGGTWPRHFKIDASGRVLLAAHQRGGTLGFFKLDPQSRPAERRSGRRPPSTSPRACCRVARR